MTAAVPPAPDPSGKRAKLSASRVALGVIVAAAIAAGVLYNRRPVIHVRPCMVHDTVVTLLDVTTDANVPLDSAHVLDTADANPTHLILAGPCIANAPDTMVARLAPVWAAHDSARAPDSLKCARGGSGADTPGVWRNCAFFALQPAASPTIPP